MKTNLLLCIALATSAGPGLSTTFSSAHAGTPGGQLQPPMLLAQAANPLSDAVRAQRGLLDTRAQEEQVRLRVAEVKRRLAERNAAVTREVYFAAKAAGIRMIPVADDLRLVNITRRNAGMSELVATQQIDGPYLVMVGHPFDPTPQFVVQGATRYGVSGFVRDDEFERTGIPSPTCAYEVWMADTQRKYPCEAYLSGKLHAAVVEDMKVALAASLTARQRENAGQR